MPSFFPVRSDLRRLLLATPGLPVVSWEGRRFKPATGVPWVKETLIPANTVTATLGTDGYQRETYIYNLVLYAPAESAVISELEDLADRIMYQYPVGFQVGGVNAHGRVVRASRTQIITGSDWLELGVRITAFFHRGNVREPT